MTDYYVRKTGSDSNDGTNPTTEAWLTIDKAANNVAAGDTVYIGAGVYREEVTMDTSGNSSNQITFVGDITGDNTGDGGLIIGTAADSESGVIVRAYCFNTNGKIFLTFRGFTCIAGTKCGIGWDSVAAESTEGIIIEDCVIQAEIETSDAAILFDLQGAIEPTGANGLIVRGCLLIGWGIWIDFNTNETADIDLKITIENCIRCYAYATSASASLLMINVDGTGTYGAGGITVYNCSVFIGGTGVTGEDYSATAYPIAVRNCYFWSSQGVIQMGAGGGTLTSDYNILMCDREVDIISAGANDLLTTDQGPALIGGFHDFPLYRFLGWSPYRLYEPIRFNDGTYLTNTINVADPTFAPADDIYGVSRPQYDNVDEVGAVEGVARAEQESTTVRAGSNAMRLDGAGFHEILLPVNANGTTTVSVYGRYDTNYTGTLPQISVIGIPGIADQTDTMTGGSDAWEQVSVAFTPTRDGVARIRLISNDTSATGKSFFDDLEVAAA